MRNQNQYANLITKSGSNRTKTYFVAFGRKKETYDCQKVIFNP